MQSTLITCALLLTVQVLLLDEVNQALSPDDGGVWFGVPVGVVAHALPLLQFVAPDGFQYKSAIILYYADAIPCIVCVITLE